MTEPVAYLVSQEPLSSVRWLSDVKPIGVDDKQITPLYTAEQLHPRVKMTHAEFDEFKRLFEYVDYASMATATIANVGDDFNKLEVMICSGNVDERIKKQNEFNVLWANYNPDNPEETIEIAPDMKWFVRSKEFDDGVYKVLEDIRLDYYEYGNVENDEETAEYGHRFDTKEEAELWTNPLTEAVQLPVEDNND